MGQVPTAPLLLVGSGRLARHLGHYFSLEGVEYETWSRGCGVDLAVAASGRRVLLCIPDDAIEPLLVAYADARVALWVHCSGCLVSEHAVGLHPLFTFAPDRLETLDVYRSIQFVGERGRPGLRDVLPELHNPYVAIEPSFKPLYHALCVLGGNLTTLLWRTIRAEADQIGVPPDAMAPYLEAVVRNLWASNQPLTGPLARGDRATVARNREALTGGPLAAVYDAFCELFESTRHSDGHAKRSP